MFDIRGNLPGYRQLQHGYMSPPVATASPHPFWLHRLHPPLRDVAMSPSGMTVNLFPSKLNRDDLSAAVHGSFPVDSAAGDSEPRLFDLSEKFEIRYP